MRTVSPGQVRVTDTDRSRTATRLHRALIEGSLTLAEFEQRTAAAYVARTHDAVAALTADLPVELPSPCPAPSRPARLASRIQNLHAVTALWLLASVLLLIAWAVLGLQAGHPAGPWPLWAIGPTGSALAIAWLATSR